MNEVKKEEADFDPSLPPGLEIKNNVCNSLIGPSLPLFTEKNNQNELCNNEIGPTIPSYLLKSLQPKTNDDAVIGPALPPMVDKTLDDEELLSPQMLFELNNDNAEIIGPLPPPQGVKKDSKELIALDFNKRSEKMKKQLEGKGTKKKLQREEWMIELPPVFQGKLGLGSRQFRARAAEIVDRSEWTDTPGDKKKSKFNDSCYSTMSHVKQRDSRIAQQMQDYNKSNKNKSESLLSIHEKTRKRKLKEDETIIRRPFDRDVDLKANEFDEVAKKKMLKQSAGLSSRFSHSKISGTFL